MQESVAELSSSIGYNITSFAANNLKGTNLPIPTSPTAPPLHAVKTLPHALARAAHTAANDITSAAGGASEGVVAAAGADRLGKALSLYAEGWDRVAAARIEQDDAITDNYLHPWQATLNQSIAIAMQARNAVKLSRLELDAAKQACVLHF